MVKNPIKSQIAYDIIRDLILSGKKLPGTHLIVSDLETELGLGRGPIREALMRLDRSGLVRNLPHRGTVVAPPPTLREVEHIFDIRLKLEGILCVEAMKHLTPEKFRTLENILLEMHDFCPDNFISLDRKFHAELYQAADMPHLCLMVEKVLESVEIYLRSYKPSHRICVTSLEEHNAMLEAMRRQDADVLTAALVKNLQHGIDTIKSGYAVHIPDVLL